MGAGGGVHGQLFVAKKQSNCRPLAIISSSIDAHYEKVRLGGRIVGAVLIAVGIDASGKRQVLGCEMVTSEAKINWSSFLESLLARGLREQAHHWPTIHAGPKEVLRAVLPAVSWQRCQSHPQQNASALVARQEARKTVADTTRHVQSPRPDGCRTALEGYT